MATLLSGSKLALGMAISVLVHLCAFFALAALLQFHISPPVEPGKLEVRLAPSLPPPLPAKPVKPLLATHASAPFAVAPTSSAAAEVTGVAFPAAVATAWSGANGASNSPFGAHSFRQDAAPYQRAMEEQTRQRSEQQAQLMMLQLQQLLAQRLDVHPVETGRCMLAESAEGASHKMSCDSPALDEVLSKDGKMVAEMLIALRGMGHMLKGFSAELRQEKPAIMLIYDEPSIRPSSEPTGVGAQ
ncbi:MAG: hypothetical protein HY016_12590 [Nitrosomonadales bacterium]|nr:hypothetical protein [Nitrosomonadales bacterium]